MNVYDSERMADVLAPTGYTPTQAPEDADMVILNTCHIREKAVEKTYSELGRIRKQINLRKEKTGKKSIVAVAGCVAQAQGKEIMKRSPWVDIVVGPQSYQNLPELIAKVDPVKKNKHINIDFPTIPKFDHLENLFFDRGPSAFLTIQEGCDKFCTFCVVPYTRGAEYSRPIKSIIDEAKKLIDGGAKEITLLGQNVNAWNGSGYDKSVWGLGKLINELAKIKELESIRYTTSHPLDMDLELLEAHRDIKKLQPYLHLPVQSGSNKVLKEMNRNYTSEEYLDIISKTREYREDIAISGDFIVGFPGETDSDFEDTLKIIKRVKYAHAYSFKYSPRPGTPAALRDDQIDEEVKSIRLKLLQELIKKQTREFNERLIEKEIDVLVEKKGVGENRLTGRSSYFQSVHMTGKESFIGKNVKVRIVEARNNSLEGTIL